MSQFRIENLSLHKVGPISLSIAAGECIAISGSSGSGKTLLLRACADLEFHQGNLFLQEINSTSITAPAWRKQVALLPAESQWWADTVAEHFPEFKQEWLTILGFEKDVLHWHVSRLSTGEKQRLSLLRLLANQPKVLLLDEPTANLDNENVQHMEMLIKQYQHDNQASLLWVSHHPEQVKRIADQHYKMCDGQIIQQERN